MQKALAFQHVTASKDWIYSALQTIAVIQRNRKLIINTRINTSIPADQIQRQRPHGHCNESQI